jgi:hypothetical protein
MTDELPPCWVCGASADSGCFAYAGCQDRACKNTGNRDRETWIAQEEAFRLRQRIGVLETALQWYADGKNWRTRVLDGRRQVILVDGREVAFKALGDRILNGKD